MSVKDKVEAIDRFVRTLKSGSNVYDDVQAACIMAGWTNLAGALTPFKGAAPTNVGFLAADLDAGIGLKGNGSSKYLNSNRAENADPQNDAHISAFVSSPHGSGKVTFVGSQYSWIAETDSNKVFRRNSAGASLITGTNTVGFAGASRVSSTLLEYRVDQSDGEVVVGSVIPSASPFNIFRYISATEYADATLSWYSIGSSTDLAALDSAVSTLMADLRSIDEAGFDSDALAYIRAVEAADGGSFLETGVKQAINRFIVGLKKDNLWDALKASCILCGARTIAGALVPLAGTAPTAYNFTSANYNRETGLVGVPASGTYIDTNRNNNADGQNDHHMAVYITVSPTSSIQFLIGAGGAEAGATHMGFGATSQPMSIRSRNQTAETVGLVSDAGFFAASRSEASGYVMRGSGANATGTLTSQTPYDGSVHVFRRNTATPYPTDARLAFYSVGSAIDLALLDSRVSTLVSEIAAAIP